MKTRLQAAADSLDADFYRLYSRAETLHSTATSKSLERDALATFLHYMREARPHLRGLMSKEDRESTS